FSTCPGILGLSGTSETDTSALLSWTPTDSALAYHVQYRPLGDTSWIDAGLSSTPSLLLTGLMGCTLYAFQVESLCDSITSSGFFLSGTFTTEGCCEAPDWTATSLQPDSTSLSWPAVYGADSYTLRYRPLGDSLWQSRQSPSNSLLLTGLEACRGYEVQVSTQCPKGPETGFSAIDTLYTTGCGACLEAPYCEAFGSSGQIVWVESVDLGPIHNPSGNDGGQGIFSLQGSTLYTDSLYQLVLVPGGLTDQIEITWRAWIDYNRDGDFEDAGELILQTAPQVPDTVTVPVLIGGAVGAGGTRLRVAVKYGNAGGSLLPPPCGDIGLGETEDYCLLIRTDRPCQIPAGLEAFFVSDSSEQAAVRWTSTPEYQSYALQYRPLGDSLWSSLTADTNYVALPPLLSCTPYELSVRGQCATDSSGFAAPITFRSRGCGACLDITYCASAGESVEYEWIQQVILDSLTFASGNDGGYADQTGTPVGVRRGDSLGLQLQPGFG
ncbi:MAG: hypothetical protein D6722_17280, partial [Bacteroidetes bacterium]